MELIVQPDAERWPTPIKAVLLPARIYSHRNGTPKLPLPPAVGYELKGSSRGWLSTTLSLGDKLASGWGINDDFAIATLCANSAQVPATNDNSDNALFAGCESFVDGQAPTPQSNMMANFCSGVVNGLAYVGSVLPPDIRSCVPPTSTARQLARVALQYIGANPQRTHEDFRELTLEAFHYAWPCE